MRVDDDPLRVAELGRDDIGRLPRHPRQPQQLVDRSRHLAAELVEENAHRALDRLRLLPEEAGGIDVTFELLPLYGQVVLGAPVLLEQRLRDPVHIYVGGLGREHHRDQQLDGVPELQRDLRVRVLDREPLDDGLDPVAPPADRTPRLVDEATWQRFRSRRTPRPGPPAPATIPPAAPRSGTWSCK